MEKTSAEHQNDSRRRSELMPLDIRVTDMAKRALARLAAHSGETQDNTLNELVLAAERDVLAKLDTAEREAFSACKPVTAWVSNRLSSSEVASLKQDLRDKAAYAQKVYFPNARLAE